MEDSVEDRPYLVEALAVDRLGSGLDHRLEDDLVSHTGDRGLTCGEYREHDSERGGGECAPEIFDKITGSAEEMGLEDGDDPAPGKGITRRSEDGLDFSRMVGVVIDDDDAAVLANELETPSHTAKICATLSEDLEFESQFHAGPDGGQGISDVVVAGEIQTDGAKNLTRLDDGE